MDDDTAIRAVLDAADTAAPRVQRVVGAPMVHGRFTYPEVVPPWHSPVSERLTKLVDEHVGVEAVQ